MKKTIKASLILAFLLILSACSEKLEARDQIFYETFDTSIRYLSYTASEKEFEEEYQLVYDEFSRLHKLYDNFNSYKGISNVKTLNDNAGKGPLKVDEDLFNLIKFSIDNYEKTNGKLNIAMGKVIKLWTDARNHNIKESLDLEDSHKEIAEEEKIIPSDRQLEEAGKHMDIKDIVLDQDKMTVEIKDPDLIIDLGAVAKGYATELVAKKLEEKGVKHASINAGGNVRTIGSPGDGRNKWGIGIQNPDLKSQDNLEVLFIGKTSVVTSGDYQRYFTKDGVKYHHIIDPKTLKPEGNFSSVTIVTEDSGLADYLSTVIFLSTKEEAEEIIKNYEDVNILWYSKDENKSFTEDLVKFMKSQGALSGK
ncbi:MAG: FAD:protein FMN transferase [Tissierellia bacterium]|nr:FAD:protein FMN transferase [Tissierellia bacterium]